MIIVNDIIIITSIYLSLISLLELVLELLLLLLLSLSFLFLSLLLLLLSKIFY